MSSHLKNYIGSQLKIHRKAAGLNQADLGAKIERTAEAISNIETGKSLAGVDTLLALAGMLEVEVVDFLPADELQEGVSPNRMKLEAEASLLLPVHVNVPYWPPIQTKVLNGDLQLAECMTSYPLEVVRGPVSWRQGVVISVCQIANFYF